MTDLLFWFGAISYGLYVVLVLIAIGRCVYDSLRWWIATGEWRL